MDHQVPPHWWLDQNQVRAGWHLIAWVEVQMQPQKKSIWWLIPPWSCRVWNPPFLGWRGKVRRLEVSDGADDRWLWLQRGEGLWRRCWWRGRGGELGVGGCPIRWLVPGLASDVQFNCYSISLKDLPVCIKRVVEVGRRSSRPLLLRQSAVVSAPGDIILKIL